MHDEDTCPCICHIRERTKNGEPNLRLLQDESTDEGHGEIGEISGLRVPGRVGLP